MVGLREVGRLGGATLNRQSYISRGSAGNGQRISGEEDNIATVFFSNFPDSHKEIDLWKLFQRWGKVWEVFIPQRRDKQGRRFGFVRFKGVKNVEEIAEELNSVWRIARGVHHH